MSIEVMKQALDALKLIDDAMPFPVAKLAMKNLRLAIEQAKRQELPELPSPDYFDPHDEETPFFSAEQMREYALDALQQKAERQEPVASVSSEVLEFLRGAAPLDGVWFGETHPTERGQFWWRKRLTTPPQRQPLTTERVKKLMDEAGYGIGFQPQARADFIAGVRHAERAHGIGSEA